MIRRNIIPKFIIEIVYRDAFASIYIIAFKS